MKKVDINTIWETTWKNVRIKLTSTNVYDLVWMNILRPVHDNFLTKIRDPLLTISNNKTSKLIFYVRKNYI